MVLVCRPNKLTTGQLNTDYSLLKIKMRIFLHALALSKKACITLNVQAAYFNCVMMFDHQIKNVVLFKISLSSLIHLAALGVVIGHE